MRSWICNRIDPRFALVPTMVLLGFATFVSSLGAAPGHRSSDAHRATEQSWYMVVDRAGILDEGQERSAINDAYRLNLYGISTQVITEPVALNQAQAIVRADELRTTNNIESRPGTNDGLVVYASVDPYDQSNIVMAISTGAFTLPRNGLDLASLDRIRDQIMTYQLAQGHPARAIVYSLREMIYLEQYVPPPAPEVAGWRSGVNGMVDILGPITGVAAMVWLIHSRRRPVGASSPPGVTLMAASVLAVVIVVMAVVTRSPLGVVAGALPGGMAVWIASRLDRDTVRGRMRDIDVMPRPPGSRKPAGGMRVSGP